MAKKAVGRPPKVLKGGLSHQEKGRVLELLKLLGDDSKESIAKIAEDLKRPVDSIKKAVNEMKSALGIDTEKEEKSLVKEKIVKVVLNQLMNSGLTKASAQSKMNRVISSFTEEQQKIVDEATLYRLCMQLTNAGDLFVNKTAGGNKGVTISNQGASERGDAARDDFHRPKNPNIFKIFDDE